MQKNKLKVLLKCWVLVLTSVVTLPAPAQTPFPALTRPVLAQVKAPERQFMLAAAEAGQRIVAVGERGLIILSDDQGVSWRQSTRVPVSITLTAVHFFDGKLGWAVGHGGTILSTADGGESWSVQANGTDLAKFALKSAEALASTANDAGVADRALRSAQQLVADGPDKPLLDVFFQDAQRGWVVGAYNLFFETTDGGKTWGSASHLLHNPRELHLYAIRAVGSDLFIVGEQGQMHRSADGGRSFQPLQSPYAGSWFTLALAQDGALVAGGLRGNLYRSVNRGDSWEQVAGVPPISFVKVVALPGQGTLVANQAGHVFVLSPDGRLTPRYKSPLSPLTSALPTSRGGLLLTGATGVLYVPAEQLKEGN